MNDELNQIQTVKVDDLPEDIRAGLEKALSGGISDPESGVPSPEPAEPAEAADAADQNAAESPSGDNAVQKPDMPDQDGEKEADKSPDSKASDVPCTEPPRFATRVIDDAGAAEEQIRNTVDQILEDSTEKLEQASEDIHEALEKLQQRTRQAERAHAKAAAAVGIEDAGIITPIDLFKEDTAPMAEAKAEIDKILEKEETKEPASKETGRASRSRKKSGAVNDEPLDYLKEVDLETPEVPEGTDRPVQVPAEKKAPAKGEDEAERIAGAIRKSGVKKGIKQASAPRKKKRNVAPFVILPLILAALIIGAVWSALHRGKAEEQEEPAIEEAALSEIPENTITVPTNAPLAEDENPELNAFFRGYYNALTNYDEDVLTAANPSLEKNDLIRMRAISEYIYNYPVVKVYTKPGPVSDSYIAYVYTHVKFADFASEVPGMQTMYVCKNSDGQFYINNDEQSEDIRNYIKKISAQDDVLALSKRVDDEYNELLTSGDDLEKFTKDLQDAIETRIGNLLAIESGQNIGEVTVPETESSETPETPGEEQSSEPDGGQQETEEQTQAETPAEQTEQTPAQEPGTTAPAAQSQTPAAQAAPAASASQAQAAPAVSASTAASARPAASTAPAASTSSAASTRPAASTSSAASTRPAATASSAASARPAASTAPASSASSAASTRPAAQAAPAASTSSAASARPAAQAAPAASASSAASAVPAQSSDTLAGKKATAQQAVRVRKSKVMDVDPADTYGTIFPQYTAEIISGDSDWLYIIYRQTDGAGNYTGNTYNGYVPAQYFTISD